YDVSPPPSFRIRGPALASSDRPRSGDRLSLLHSSNLPPVSAHPACLGRSFACYQSAADRRSLFRRRRTSLANSKSPVRCRSERNHYTNRSIPQLARLSTDRGGVTETNHFRSRERGRAL